MNITKCNKLNTYELKKIGRKMTSVKSVRTQLKNIGGK